MPHIVSLPLDNLKPMHQLGYNARIHGILHKNQLLCALLPALAKELILQLADLDPLALGFAVSEKRVLDLDFGDPVEDALFGGGRSKRRLDACVEVGDAAVVCVGLDGEIEVGGADGLALDPADALELEDGVVVVGQRLVLIFLRACVSLFFSLIFFSFLLFFSLVSLLV